LAGRRRHENATIPANECDVISSKDDLCHGQIKTAKDHGLPYQPGCHPFDRKTEVMRNLLAPENAHGSRFSLEHQSTFNFDTRRSQHIVQKGNRSMRIITCQNDFLQTCDRIGMDTQFSHILRERHQPLTRESKEISHIIHRGKSKPETSLDLITVRRLYGSAEFEGLAAGNSGCDIMPMIARCVVAGDHDGRQAFTSAATAISQIALDKDIAFLGMSPRLAPVRNSQWLQIGTVFKKNTGIGRTEGMHAVRRDSETQRRQPLACLAEISNRQNEMIDIPSSHTCPPDF